MPIIPSSCATGKSGHFWGLVVGGFGAGGGQVRNNGPVHANIPDTIGAGFLSRLHGETSNTLKVLVFQLLFT